MGFARIEGDPNNFRGINIRTPTLEQTGDGARGRKASGMLCVDGIFHLAARNAGASQLAWSTDHGKNWQWADWKFTKRFGCPTFVNFGKNYDGNTDGYVYLISPDADDAYTPADQFVLWVALRLFTCSSCFHWLLRCWRWICFLRLSCTILALGGYRRAHLHYGLVRVLPPPPPCLIPFLLIPFPSFPSLLLLACLSSKVSTNGQWPIRFKNAEKFSTSSTSLLLSLSILLDFFREDPLLSFLGSGESPLLELVANSFRLVVEPSFVLDTITVEAGAS